MNTNEFSEQFDVQINAFNIPEGIAFNEYEKSVFLTKAQDELVDAYYAGTIQGKESFEGDEELRRYLSNLVETKELAPFESDNMIGSSVSSYFFSLPNNVRYIIFEQAKLESSDKCLDGKFMEVVPTTHDDLHKTIRNPFKYHERKVLRLDIRNNVAELISKNKVALYKIRYIINPSPIVLENLAENSIKGFTWETDCILPESLHKQILDRAVQLALSSKNINIKQTEKA